MSYFRLSTHYKSNTQISNDPKLIVAVVEEMLGRNRQVLIVPEPITDEQYHELAAGKAETFDPVAIADWISIIPEPAPEGSPSARRCRGCYDPDYTHDSTCSYWRPL